MQRRIPGGKLAAAALALGAILASGPAAALPNYEINWEYYSDATYTEIVGGRTISCSGNGGRWGVQTEYARFVQGEKCERDPPFPGWNDPPVEW
ncbi:DUF6289 family protein [Brevundimonas sp.]|uniref:DUF6289 family protein n=1 Tax=Brevundimonas sp. TaxID=1871086 RepID=UPI002BAC8EC7|nr:DUF6289 family protein [Brevundimonas sp.]HWQ86545.1 DUF6289 family protein [Brevundimonas sp.]